MARYDERIGLAPQAWPTARGAAQASRKVAVALQFAGRNPRNLGPDAALEGGAEIPSGSVKRQYGSAR